MKKRSRTLICILTALLAVAMLLMTSCGKGSDSGIDRDNASSGYYGDKASGTEEASPAPGLLDTPDGDGTQKLIRTCTVEAETRDFDAASASLNERISRFDGYVESQKSSGSSYGASKSSRLLTVTVRIPADKFGDFVTGLGDIMNVTSAASNVENVTETYYDAEARLATLKAERESLQKMMASLDNAKQYDFWLTLQKRLSETEQDIASLEARLRSYDNRVAYSTVTLTMREVIEFKPTETPTFAARISKAFTSSWRSFAEFWQDFAVFFVSALPTLCVIAVIAVTVIIIVVASAKKRKNKN